MCHRVCVFARACMCVLACVRVHVVMSSFVNAFVCMNVCCVPASMRTCVHVCFRVYVRVCVLPFLNACDSTSLALYLQLKRERRHKSNSNQINVRAHSRASFTKGASDFSSAPDPINRTPAESFANGSCRHHDILVVKSDLASFRRNRRARISRPVGSRPRKIVASFEGVCSPLRVKGHSNSEGPRGVRSV